MTPAERALLRDLSTALGDWIIIVKPMAGNSYTIHYIAALQKRIREALQKEKGKRKQTRAQAKALREEMLDGDGRRG